MFAQPLACRLPRLAGHPRPRLGPTPVAATPALPLTRVGASTQLASTPERPSFNLRLSCVLQARLTCVCACTASHCTCVFAAPAAGRSLPQPCPTGEHPLSPETDGFPLPSRPPRRMAARTLVGATLKVTLRGVGTTFKVARWLCLQARDGCVRACTPLSMIVALSAPSDAGQTSLPSWRRHHLTKISPIAWKAPGSRHRRTT
jgi:hypothetical protein